MQEHRRRRATQPSGPKPLTPFGLRAASPRLLRCISSTMLRHRLVADASHPRQRRPQRDPLDFHHGLLGRQEWGQTPSGRRLRL